MYNIHICHIKSYYFINIISYYIILFHVISYHIMSYHIISYQIHMSIIPMITLVLFTCNLVDPSKAWWTTPPPPNAETHPVANNHHVFGIISLEKPTWPTTSPLLAVPCRNVNGNAPLPKNVNHFWRSLLLYI